MDREEALQEIGRLSAACAAHKQELIETVATLGYTQRQLHSAMRRLQAVPGIDVQRQQEAARLDAENAQRKQDLVDNTALLGFCERMRHEEERLLAAVQAQCRDVRAEMQMLQQKKREALHEVGRLEREVKGFHKYVTEVGPQITSIINDVQRARDTKTQLEKECNAVRNEKALLEKERATVRADLRRLTAEIEHARSQHPNISSSIAHRNNAIRRNAVVNPY